MLCVCVHCARRGLQTHALTPHICATFYSVDRRFCWTMVLVHTRWVHCSLWHRSMRVKAKAMSTAVEIIGFEFMLTKSSSDCATLQPKPGVWNHLHTQFSRISVSAHFYLFFCTNMKSVGFFDNLWNVGNTVEGNEANRIIIFSRVSLVFWACKHTHSQIHHLPLP